MKNLWTFKPGPDDAVRATVRDEEKRDRLIGGFMDGFTSDKDCTEPHALVTRICDNNRSKLLTDGTNSTVPK